MKFLLWKYPVHFIATGFGSGWSPVAPGTVGSLVGVVAVLIMASMSTGSYAAAVLGLFVVGIFICRQTALDFSAIDPGFIVFDEIVGFMVAMYLLPKTTPWLIAGFFIFRLFDIWKPFPIHVLEMKLELGTAIMADDVVAGIYTLVVLHSVKVLIRKFT